MAIKRLVTHTSTLNHTAKRGKARPGIQPWPSSALVHARIAAGTSLLAAAGWYMQAETHRLFLIVRVQWNTPSCVWDR